MLSIHRIFFLVKMGSEARIEKQLLRILCLRVHHGVLKRTPEENIKVRYINIFIYSQFLLLLIYISNHVTNIHIYIYINTFPLTFIEDSMVEGKSHTA